MATALAEFLHSPTTRCNTCHADLDLAHAASHNCVGFPLHSSAPSSSSSSIPFQTAPQSMSTHRNGPLPGKLPKFAPPARIDPFAANEAFLSPANLSGDGRPSSPYVNTPRTDSAASGRFRLGPRSATTPIFRNRSPSPKMRMPQDGAFPLFPTKKVRQDRAKKERERSKSMSRSQSADPSRQHRFGSSSTSASRSASPALPQSPFPNTLGGRKSSLSGQRPKFDDEADEPVPPLPPQMSLSGRASPKPERRPSPPADSQITSPLAGPPITSYAGDQALPLQSQVSPGYTHYKQPSISAAIQPLDAIGSTRRLSPDVGLVIPQSQSVNSYRGDQRVDQAPRIPELQSATIEHHPHPWNPESALPESPVLPITAHSGIQGHANDQEEFPESAEDVLGSLPSIKATEPTNSLSTNRARESASSDGSSYSVAQSASSRSSPPTSASSFTLQNDLPRGENIDSVLSDIAEGTKPPPSSAPASSPNGILPIDSDPSSASEPLQEPTRGPAKSFSRPNYVPPQLDLSPRPVNNMPNRPFNRGPPPPPTLRSPMDNPRPDFRSPRTGTGQRSPGSETRSPGDSRSPPSTSPMSPRIPQMPRPVRPGDPYANVPPSPAGSIRRPMTPGFKGNCRGCGEMIVGKSVSSADGRLTGRYHKQCFVCRTCKEPFQTADFYVMDNHPYCHRHYHTLNGSLCSVCDRGIEGPYMETDAQKKFHPHCFTCKECHLILRHDYFEIDGAIYCEKHSRKTDLLGPGRRYPERRTTRLMMM